MISNFNRICFGFPIFRSFAGNESCRDDLKHWGKSFIWITCCSVSSLPSREINENFNKALLEGFLGKLKLPVGILDVWNVICQVFVEGLSSDLTVDVELVSVGDFDRF